MQRLIPHRQRDTQLLLLPQVGDKEGRGGGRRNKQIQEEEILGQKFHVNFVTLSEFNEFFHSLHKYRPLVLRHLEELFHR